MLTSALLLLGTALIVLVLAEKTLRRLPLSPALIYLALGWLAGVLIGAPDTDDLLAQSTPLVIVSEFAVLVSLFAVGVRLRAPLTLYGWRVALLMAGPGMIVTIVLSMAAGMLLLGLSLPAALLLGAIIAPTDPVLASDVQIRSESDRDAVRLSLTAEAGLNDSTAFPAVMLALALLGLHGKGVDWRNWWLADVTWPILGGAMIGAAIAWLLGQALRRRLMAGDRLARDELLTVGAVALAYGVARAADVSAFIVAFIAGIMLLRPLHGTHMAENAKALAGRMHDFGARYERLVEAAMVLSVGVALHGVDIEWEHLAFAAVLLGLVRPVSVLTVVHRRMLLGPQRRLVAWFGIRGIGSLFYLAFAFESGLERDLAHNLVAGTLSCIALSIFLHGISATPLMLAHHRRRVARPDAQAGPPFR